MSGTALPATCKVVIIGAGIAGCMSAVHLFLAGVRDIVVIDAGDAGVGITTPVKVVDKQFINSASSDYNLTEFKYANRSGTAVLPSPVSSIKMVINLYPCSTEEFIKHHGKDGAKAYLKLAKRGIELEKRLAEMMFPGVDLETNFRQLGSQYVTDQAGSEGLKKEFNDLKELGAVEDLGIEWMNTGTVQETHGAKSNFVAGIFFPHDAIVDSAKLCKNIIEKLMAANTAENGRAGQDFVLKYFPSVTMRSVSEEIGGQVTTTYRVKDADADQKITSTYVVVATGGFSIDPILAGILSPRWSYLTGINTVVAAPKDIYANDVKLPYDYSPNFFTWGYTHDWCIVNGYVRISGEDHYSAMKPPRMKERCQAMATWVGEKYPYLEDNTKQYMEQYGVYSETPDHLPILGTINNDSRICYIVGCNAWGQASLTFSASMVPYLLKVAQSYQWLISEDKEAMKLLSIRRFQLLPAIRPTA